MLEDTKENLFADLDKEICKRLLKKDPSIVKMFYKYIHKMDEYEEELRQKYPSENSDDAYARAGYGGLYADYIFDEIDKIAARALRKHGLNEHLAEKLALLGCGLRCSPICLSACGGLCCGPCGQGYYQQLRGTSPL